MPGPIGLEIREAAVAAYLGKEGTLKQVAARFGISRPSLERYLALHRTGSLAPKTDYARGRPPQLTESDRQLLRELALQDRQATWEQLRDRLAERTGKRVGVKTVGRSLRALGLRRVRPERPAGSSHRPASPRREPRRYTASHRRDPREGYPTDLTDAEWALLEPFFVSRTRTFDYPPRRTLDAIFYVLRTGCAWRMLPHDFPPWDTVYSAFRRWQADGRLASCYEALRRRVRVREGRRASPTGAVVDSQSVKTTEKGGLADTTEASVCKEESDTSS